MGKLAQKQEAAKSGRPSKYTKKLAESICKRMASGDSLRTICRNDNMPNKSTIMLWVANDREGFSDQYAKAFEARMYHHADELLDIADDGSNDFMEDNNSENQGYKTNGEAIARSRLRVDTRKWLMSKLLPRYADKQEESNADKVIAEALKEIADKLPS